MKKQYLIKQLANRINQPHVVESWINKIEKASYDKGYKDAESKQCDIPVVSQQRELLVAYEMYCRKTAGCDEDKVMCEILADKFLATNCG